MDPLSHRTTTVFDALDRPVAMLDALNHRSTVAYDAVGNAIAETDPLSQTTSYGYDALDRRVTTTDPLGFVTTVAFDAVGNRTVLVDAAGNRTTWTYDALDRVTAETDPLNATATTAYDAAGRTTGETDRLGRRKDYAYDAAGRLETEKWYAVGGALAQTQTWTYDAADRVLTAQDPDGTYTLAYDAAGRVSSVQEPFGLALSFAYDAAGNRTRVEDSQGGTATMVFDALNRQTSEQLAGSGVSQTRFDYAYDAAGRRTSLTRYADAAGTTVVGTTAYEYDADDRLTHLLHTTGAGSVLGNYTYSYDATDRLTEKVEDGTSTTYQYDTADQLTRDGAGTFGYDATGNRTNAGYATGSGNHTDPSGQWIVAKSQKEAQDIKAWIESLADGLTVPPPRLGSEGGPLFPWLIGEVSDSAGMQKIAEAIVRNQQLAPGNERDKRHYYLAALQHNANPHVDVASWNPPGDVYGRDYFVGVGHQNPVIQAIPAIAQALAGNGIGWTVVPSRWDQFTNSWAVGFALGAGGEIVDGVVGVYDAATNPFETAEAVAALADPDVWREILKELEEELKEDFDKAANGCGVATGRLTVKLAPAGALAVLGPSRILGIAGKVKPGKFKPHPGLELPPHHTLPRVDVPSPNQYATPPKKPTPGLFDNTPEGDGIPLGTPQKTPPAAQPQAPAPAQPPTQPPKRTLTPTERKSKEMVLDAARKTKQDAHDRLAKIADDPSLETPHDRQIAKKRIEKEIERHDAQIKELEELLGNGP